MAGEQSEVITFALQSYKNFLDVRGVARIYPGGREEVLQVFEDNSLPIDDPQFVATALVGAMAVFIPLEQRAYREIHEDLHLTEITSKEGAAAIDTVNALGYTLKKLLGIEVLEH